MAPALSSNPFSKDLESSTRGNMKFSGGGLTGPIKPRAGTTLVHIEKT